MKKKKKYVCEQDFVGYDSESAPAGRSEKFISVRANFLLFAGLGSLVPQARNETSCPDKEALDAQVGVGLERLCNVPLKSTLHFVGQVKRSSARSRRLVTQVWHCENGKDKHGSVNRAKKKEGGEGRRGVEGCGRGREAIKTSRTTSTTNKYGGCASRSMCYQGDAAAFPVVAVRTDRIMTLRRAYRNRIARRSFHCTQVGANRRSNVVLLSIDLASCTGDVIVGRAAASIAASLYGKSTKLTERSRHIMYRLYDICTHCGSRSTLVWHSAYGVSRIVALISPLRREDSSSTRVFRTAVTLPITAHCAPKQPWRACLTPVGLQGCFQSHARTPTAFISVTVTLHACEI